MRRFINAINADGNLTIRIIRLNSALNAGRQRRVRLLARTVVQKLQERVSIGGSVFCPYSLVRFNMLTAVNVCDKLLEIQI